MSRRDRQKAEVLRWKIRRMVEELEQVDGNVNAKAIEALLRFPERRENNYVLDCEASGRGDGHLLERVRTAARDAP